MTAAAWWAAGLLGLALVGCGAPPVPTNPAEIESVGILATQARQSEALAKLRTWSERDQNPVAQRELALALLQERSQQAQGLQWLERAAQSGDGEAGYQLGEALRLGRYGLSLDAPKARGWLDHAARHGSMDAALSLARMWRNGDGGARDEANAFQLLKTAAERGNAQAMFLLSSAYSQGQGTAVQWERARYWLEAAADHHYPPALQAYALALENGELGFAKDRSLARDLLAEAAEERPNRWNTR